MDRRSKRACATAELSGRNAQACKKFTTHYALCIEGDVQQRLFFLHNPKADGTSIRGVFPPHFEERQIAPTFFNAPQDYSENKHRLKDFGGFDLYLGRYGFDEFSSLSNVHDLLANFREPIERIKSLYRFWRFGVPTSALSSLLANDAACVAYAKDLLFSSLNKRADPMLRLYLDDFHFRQLAMTLWQNQTSGECEIDIVKTRIDCLKWFYVAEMALESTITFNNTFPELAIDAMPMLNGSPQSDWQLEKADIAFL